MPHVLLVEDDSFKSDEIKTLLLSVSPSTQINLATSVSAAIGAIKDSSFDLVVLDMALPSHTASAGAGAPLSLLTGGLEVLFELQSLGRKDPCFVVTQYPEIEICGTFYPLSEASEAIERCFEIRVLDCIEYNDANARWRTTLDKLFRELCAS